LISAKSGTVVDHGPTIMGSGFEPHSALDEQGKMQENPLKLLKSF